jgi:hypothetical protein
VDKKIDVVYPGKHIRNARDKSDTFAALDFFRIRTWGTPRRAGTEKIFQKLLNPSEICDILTASTSSDDPGELSVHLIPVVLRDAEITPRDGERGVP